MKHEFEKSSSLKHCDHNPKTCRLEIGFTSGGTYHYDDVPPNVFEALKAAKSPGSFFHQNIRNKYPAKQKPD